jgi:hypothetical protein
MRKEGDGTKYLKKSLASKKVLAHKVKENILKLKSNISELISGCAEFKAEKKDLFD